MKKKEWRDYINDGYIWQHNTETGWSVYTKGLNQHIFYQSNMHQGDVIVPYNGSLENMPKSLSENFYGFHHTTKNEIEEENPTEKYQSKPNSRFTNGIMGFSSIALSLYLAYSIYPHYSKTMYIILGGLIVFGIFLLEDAFNRDKKK